MASIPELEPNTTPYEPPTSTLEVLERTYALLDRPWGWVKQHFIKRRGSTFCFCLDGALRVACGAQISDSPHGLSVHSAPFAGDLEKAHSRIAIAAQIPKYQIWEWNDHRRTTKSDVLKALRRAITTEKEATTA